MSWSSGKDSALALHRARQDPELDVVGMLCTVNADADRVAMHAVRRELLLAQGERLGLPIHVVELPWPCPNAEYERLMAAAVEAAVADGVSRMIFGDLFLADIRAYRERMLEPTGITPVFPLWAEPTDQLARRDDRRGRARGAHVRRSAAARVRARGPRLRRRRCSPPCRRRADPCGENGEFHTFVWDAPGFSSPIAVELGEIVTRDGFVFADVIPAS